MVQTERKYSADRGGSNGDTVDPNILSQMEKGFKIWQALLGFIGLLMSVGTILINQSNKIETQRLRIEFLEEDSREKGLLLKDLNQRQEMQYKEINTKLTDILVNLQNKENKK